MPCQRDSQSSCIDRSLRMASPGSPRELMSQHWALTGRVQFQFDQSGVAGDAARGKIVGLDEGHEPACCEQNSVVTDAVVAAALIDDGFVDERLVASSRS